MALYPPLGAYAATGLPADDAALFRAWLFLCRHSAQQPLTYRNDTTQRLAKQLIDNGERRINVTGAALLAMMPATLETPITRLVGAEVPRITKEFSQHAATRFAYIDQASPEVKKIALAYLINTLHDLQEKGDALLEKLALMAMNGQTAVQVHIDLLTDPRSFLLVAEKTQDTTGNRRLENVFTDAALAYAHYYQSFLQQMATSEAASPTVRRAFEERMAEAGPLPDLHQTAIPVQDVILAAYTQICMDPRVSHDRAVMAIRLTEVIADSGEAAPALLAAALLQTALPHISATDEDFLQKVGLEDALDILRDNADAAKQSVPLDQAPMSMRQIELARAILNLRDGQMFIDLLQEKLDGPLRAIADDTRRHYVAKNLRPLNIMLHDMQRTLVPRLDQLDCPALAEETRAQLRLLSHMMDRIGNDVGLGLRPQPQTPRTPNDGHRGGWN